MKQATPESKKKQQLKAKLEKIQSVFNLSPEAIMKHPQLSKLQEYIKSPDGTEKYAVGGGSSDTYIVNAEYAVQAVSKPEKD